MGKRLVLAVAVLCVFFAMGCAKKADDAAIITNIQSQMFSDPQLKGSDVKVTSTHGEVTLSGTVPGDAARLDAYKLALQTVGVTKVNDQMSVTSAQAPNVADESASTTPASAHEPCLTLRQPKAKGGAFVAKESSAAEGSSAARTRTERTASSAATQRH